MSDKASNIIRWFSWIRREKKRVASLLSDEIHEMTYHIHPVTDRAYWQIRLIIPESENNLAKSLTLFFTYGSLFYLQKSRTVFKIKLKLLITKTKSNSKHIIEYFIPLCTNKN